MPRRSRVTHSRPGRTSCPSASSQSTRPWIVSPLRHRTSVTRTMCSLSRVMSAGDSEVFLPSGAARGELRFQRYGVFWLIPSNNPGHKRALDLVQAPRSNMSRNQSHTMGSTWTLRRFAVLLLGSTSTNAVAARGVLTWAISSCVSGRSMVSPAPGEHVPRAAASWRVRATALRPTDRAMAVCSVRTSSSEEESRSTDEDGTANHTRHCCHVPLRIPRVLASLQTPGPGPRNGERNQKEHTGDHNI